MRHFRETPSFIFWTCVALDLVDWSTVEFNQI